jgi:REP element-mobilizing transposase RayT
LGSLDEGHIQSAIRTSVHLGSVYGRIPIFRNAIASGIFLRALEAYRQKYSFLVLGYVLMPDHFHLLVWFPETGGFVDFLRDFKSFVGKRIIDWMKEENLVRLLVRFQIPRPGQRRRDAKYCVLQYNNYIKAVLTPEGLWKTLEYIHLNPVKEGLVRIPQEYLLSSAGDYMGGKSRIVQVERMR